MFSSKRPKPTKKTAVARQALRSVNTIFEYVRIDNASGKGSSMDVIRLVLGSSSKAANTYLTRLISIDETTPSIKSRTTYVRINGVGRLTPVADLKTLLEIVWKLPGPTSAKFRCKSAEIVCRAMGGDERLIQEIQQNNLLWRSVPGGEAIQKALLQPMEYREAEASSKTKECSVRDALASSVGGEAEVETPAGNIDVLSDTEVIEVKNYKQWKHGLGQVLAYHTFHPGLAKRLHLFAHSGEDGTRKYFDLAKSVCAKHDVRVTFEVV
ncbi:unnamed protein product, partial [Pylaiella littoralis]